MDACAFATFEPRQGLLCDLSSGTWPVSLAGWRGDAYALATDATTFGFVFEGPAHLACEQGEFLLKTGMYFAVRGPGRVGGTGSGMLVVHPGYQAFFQVGGPIEREGRLRYIDGCTDSLLIPPVLYGDPCLNLLHFPPGIDQTAHTHPSPRLGIVVRGSGICRLPNEDVVLRPGLAFHIPENTIHAFATDGSFMDVIAYHPDSDFGPKHQDHPMINRTIVDGVSANQLSYLQTSSP